MNYLVAFAVGVAVGAAFITFISLFGRTHEKCGRLWKWCDCCRWCGTTTVCETCESEFDDENEDDDA